MLPHSAAQLHRLIPQIQAHGYAPRTLRDLRSHWKAYLNFCYTYRQVPLPASGYTMATFASYLACKTLSFQYHLNAVHLLHHYNGFPTDTLDSFEVKLTKRGLKRLLGTLAKNTRLPHLYFTFFVIT